MRGFQRTNINTVTLIIILFQANVLMWPEPFGRWWEREQFLEGLLLSLAFKPPHTLASIFLPRFLLILLCMRHTFLNCFLCPHFLHAFPCLPLYSLCALRLPFPHLCSSKAYSSFRTWFKGHLLLNLLSHPPLPGSDLSLSELPGRFSPLIMFYSIPSLTSGFLGQKLCFIFCPPLSPA